MIDDWFPFTRNILPKVYESIKNVTQEPEKSGKSNSLESSKEEIIDLIASVVDSKIEPKLFQSEDALIGNLKKLPISSANLTE